MQNQNQSQSQQSTGTRNETYDLISVLYHALQGAENCKTYMNDAKDGNARDFFKKALQAQRQLADEGKQVLQECLKKDSGGQSAFGWGSSSGQGSSGQSQGSGSNQGSMNQQSSSHSMGTNS